MLPARARGARLLLNPANLAPLAFPRNAVVIHDAAALRHPGWYSPVYARWQRGILPLVARRARLVITVSEFSRRELAELLRVDAAVVPGGIDARFAPDADPEPARAALGLEPALRPHRGQPHGAQERRRAGDDRAPAGRRRHRSRRRRRRSPAVPRRGRGPARSAPSATSPTRTCPGLYAGARAFVLPSWHEGFGLTCIEAMACGVPVVAARAGALPETCGDAARYADPFDQDEIADQVQAALDDDALRAAGPRHAAQYTLGAHGRRARRAAERRLTGRILEARWSSRARPCAR